MKRLAFLCLATFSLAADIPSEPIAQKGELILMDEFERTDLGQWKPLIGTFTVEGGVLKGVLTTAPWAASTMP
jgi:hypothetical protein